MNILRRVEPSWSLLRQNSNYVNSARTNVAETMKRFQAAQQKQEKK